MYRNRIITALLSTAVLGMSVPSAVPAATQKKHCVKYKAYKKHGKRYTRCSRYSRR